MAGCDQAVPGPAPGRRRHTGDHAGRGRDPAAPRPRGVRPHGVRGVPEGGGRQPDRVVQGPGHDGRGEHGGGAGRHRRHLRLHRQHQRERRRLRRPGRPRLRGAGPARQDRPRQAGPGAGARGEAAAGGRQLRRLPGARPQAGQRVPGRPGQLGEPGPAGGPEDRGLRDRRGPRRRPRRALPAGRERRQHHRLLAGLPRVRRGRARHPHAPDVRLPGQRSGADRAR